MINEAERLPEAFYRVRMMMAQMIVVVLATFTIFSAPLSYGAAALTAIYGALLLAERRMSIRSPLTAGTLLLSVVVLLANWLTDLGAYSIYISAAYYGLLLLIGTVSLIRRHPMSLYYSDGYGSLDLHWKTSVLWVLIYAIGFVLSLLIPSYTDLFWLLPVLPVVGVLETLWLQLVDMGPRWRRAAQFSMGSIRVEEVASNREQLAPFYVHFVREAAHSLKQGREVRKLSFDQLLQLKMECDSPSWNKTKFFVAIEGDEIVGTISCILKTADAQLGVEAGISEPLNLEPLAKHGKIIEVGRFSISDRHRFRQELVQGLLRAVVEYAFEKDAAFLVAQAYPNVVPIYSKIGFQKISDRVVHQKGTGSPVMLLVFNLAKRAICELEEPQTTSRLETVLSPYLGERFFKRQSLLSIFNRRRPWSISSEQLTQLCLTTSVNDLRGVRNYGA